MNVVLVMFRGDGDRRSFSLARDLTVVGRREDCDLRIPVGDVSRKHCRFIREADTLRVEDLGSSNGTFVNGERVQESVVRAGDYIQIGPVQFVLQIDGYPADEDIADPTAITDADATGDFTALEEVTEESPLPEFAAEESPAEPLEESPEPPALDELELEPATDVDIDEVDFGTEPPEATEAEPIEAAAMEDEPAATEPPPPPPPPVPALHDTHALPPEEIPAPAAAPGADDGGEWNFVLEEAEPESSAIVDLGLDASKSNESHGHS